MGAASRTLLTPDHPITRQGKTREHAPEAGQGIEDDESPPPAAGEDGLPNYDMGLQPLTRPTV